MTWRPQCAPCKVQLEAPEEIQFAADRAILVALIINELVLNAGKHAYPNSSGGSIWVRVVRTEKDTVQIFVRDDATETGKRYRLVSNCRVAGHELPLMVQRL